MRTHICTATAAALLALGATPALAATPPDAGNCWGAWVNGGDNGTSVSADAGPRYGRSFADVVAGGAVGRLVSSADCHS
jgi:hypothetical protein